MSEPEGREQTRAGHGPGAVVTAGLVACLVGLSLLVATRLELPGPGSLERRVARWVGLRHEAETDSGDDVWWLELSGPGGRWRARLPALERPQRDRLELLEPGMPVTVMVQADPFRRGFLWLWQLDVGPETLLSRADMARGRHARADQLRRWLAWPALLLGGGLLTLGWSRRVRGAWR